MLSVQEALTYVWRSAPTDIKAQSDSTFERFCFACYAADKISDSTRRRFHQDQLHAEQVQRECDSSAPGMPRQLVTSKWTYMSILAISGWPYNMAIKYGFTLKPYNSVDLIWAMRYGHEIWRYSIVSEATLNCGVPLELCFGVCNMSLTL